MTERQHEILKRLDLMVKPLETKVKELDEFCKDGHKIVAPLALREYMAELNEWKELKLIIMEEFLQQEECRWQSKETNTEERSSDRK